MKDEHLLMAGLSFRFRCALRIGRATRRDGRAGHVATYGDAAAVCPNAGGVLGRKEMEEGRPKPRGHNDQSTSDPSENLLIALVAQEPPERVHDSCPTREHSLKVSTKCAPEHPAA